MKKKTRKEDENQRVLDSSFATIHALLLDRRQNYSFVRDKLGPSEWRGAAEIFTG